MTPVNKAPTTKPKLKLGGTYERRAKKSERGIRLCSKPV